MSNRVQSHHHPAHHRHGRVDPSHPDERSVDAHAHGHGRHRAAPPAYERHDPAHARTKAQGKRSACQCAGKPAAYTLGHRGRQVRIGPVAFWICVGTLVIMAAWSVVTATYFAFHDDVLARLLARQAQMQAAYEDRIAEMRAQIDRVTSRQLLDQEQFADRLAQLLKRQATLEQRANALSALADPTVTGSIKPPARGMSLHEAPLPLPKPSPINDATILAEPPDREARYEPRIPSAALIARPARAARSDDSVEHLLARVQASLDAIETRQTRLLNALEEGYDAKIRRIRNALSDIGLDLGKGRADLPTGGPFVPFKMSAHATAFDRQIQRIRLARAQTERLTRLLSTVPIRAPISGEIDTTSGFGVRIDPFLGRPAMHTGLDFRGDPGDPVRATAAGAVVAAGWSGGYGKMVEIDHGHGLSTRFGHLSEIDVQVGQFVKAGQIIGRLGSTGRSTGPHLHYETRIEGEAVDPQKFLRAGQRLGGL